MSVHLGLYEDETSARCQWHLPATHFLEAWSDARAFDGTVTIHAAADRAALRGTFGARARRDARRRDIAQRLRHRARHSGRRGSAAISTPAGKPRCATASSRTRRSPRARSTLRNDALHAAAASIVRGATRPIVARACSSCPTRRSGDGRFANNAWLQELPRPLTKLTWDNAALIAPALARAARRSRTATSSSSRIGGAQRAKRRSGSCRATPTARSALRLGYGRTRAGRVGDGVGFDAYALRTADAPWFARGVDAAQDRRGRTRSRPRSTIIAMEGRDLVRVATLAQIRARPARRDRAREAAIATRIALSAVRRTTATRWAMAIDLDACIGCNACTIACQAENNIPTVGKEEVARGREMHWIRVDRYYEGAPDAPRTHVPAGAVHAMRARAVRGRVPGRRDGARQRRASTCRSTTAASARASAPTTARTRCAASTSCSTRRRRPRASRRSAIRK